MSILSNGLLYSKELEAALQEYAHGKDNRITHDLSLIIENIAETGIVCFNWRDLSTLVHHKLYEILNEKFSNDASITVDEYEGQRDQLLEEFLEFNGAPFTIQRICELILSHGHIISTKKLLFALEKLINVNSILPKQDPFAWAPRRLPVALDPADERTATPEHLRPLMSGQPLGPGSSPSDVATTFPESESQSGRSNAVSPPLGMGPADRRTATGQSVWEPAAGEDGLNTATGQTPDPVGASSPPASGSTSLTPAPDDTGDASPGRGDMMDQDGVDARDEQGDTARGGGVGVDPSPMETENAAL